ncbi:MAG: FAD-dependent oxidoreductase [Acidimicrobiales bacterium]
MAQPVLLVLDDDADGLADIERELQDRYARHYQVVCLRSPEAARARLEELAASGAEVAVVLAGQWSAPPVRAVLDDAGRLHPQARRGALIAWGDWGRKETGDAIFAGIAEGHIDQHVMRPSPPPDEVFHQTITGMLVEWAEAQRTSPYTVHVVGESWSGRAYELREALKECAVVHHFCLADSDEGRALLAGAGDGIDLPLVVLPDGTYLQNPTNAEIALTTGGAVQPDRSRFDAVIVGAGPAGLSAAVYGASEGFSTLVVDRGGIGGQATSSSLIRNYLGFPRGISGRQLAQNAYGQAWVFGARFAFMQTVTGLDRDGDGLVVTLSDVGPVRTAAVLLATGASYRRLGVPSLEALHGAGVFYGGSTAEAPALVGRDVFIVGGANSAGQAALHLARYAARVTLVVRAPSLRAGMSEYLVRQVEATPNVDVRLGSEVVGGGGDGRLEHLVLRDRESQTDTTVDAQALFVLIGARPNTDWLPADLERDPQGFVLTGAEVSDRFAAAHGRDPLLLETSMPGVFAAGDVRHGSVKRVASAVGEGSIAVQLLHQLFAAEPRLGSPLARTGGVAMEPVAKGPT